MQQIYRRTSMLKCDFNKVAKHGCSPVNLLYIFRTSLLKNTSEWPLLNTGQLIISHLNVKSLRNKFEMLQEIIKYKLEIFLISQAKLDRSFQAGQFMLKGGLSTSKKSCVICFSESPLKIMKNGFYFILKAPFVLKIFKFLSWLFGHLEKTARLER